MAEEKSTLQEAREAFAKTRAALKKTEAKVEEKTGALLRFGVTLGAGWVAGAGHELFGKMDERAGVKICRVGGVNVGLGLAFAGLGAELLEAGGKNSEWIGIAGGGVGAEATGIMGRVFIRQVQVNKMQRDAAKLDAAKKAAALEASKGKTAQDALNTATAQAAPVAASAT